MPVPDFRKSNQQSAYLLRIEKQLEQLIQDEASRTGEVQLCAGRLTDRLVEEVLQSLPVSRLSGGGQGVRTAALTQAGYQNLRELSILDSTALQGIPGIGPANASRITELLGSFRREIRRAARIRLSPEDSSAEQTSIRRALYRYFRTEPLRRQCAQLLSEHQAELTRAAQGRRLRNRLQWLLAGKAKKAAALEAMQTMDALIGGDFHRQAMVLFRSYAAVMNAADDAVLADFRKNSADYYAALEELDREHTLRAASAHGDLSSALAGLVEETPLDSSLLRVTLRSYQRFGAKYILCRKRVLIGDEMGLGKTIQALAAMASLQAASAERLHFMVLCPAGLLVNWIREIARRSALHGILIHGASHAAPLARWCLEGGVAVTNYETADECETFLTERQFSRRISLLVVDEAHYIKNPQAKRSLWSELLSARADRVAYLTGTPMDNRPQEMLHLIHNLNPEIAERASALTQLADLSSYREQISPVYLRRKRDAVLTELPEITEEEQWCTMTEADLLWYRHAVRDGSFMSMRQVGWKREALPSAGTPSSGGPGVLTGGAAPLTAGDVPASKAVRLLEIMDRAGGEDRKVIVFSYFRDVIDCAARLLGAQTAGIITGSVSASARQEIIDRFTAAPGSCALICQIQAGGLGLNIQAASVIVFCEPQLVPSLERQAVGRACRMGQVNHVLVYHLLCEASVDEYITELLESKRQAFGRYADRSAIGEASSPADHEWIAEVIAKEQARYAQTPESAPRIADSSSS